ncbi:PQQ-binding-like beta-propeller repeat protein [Aquimarina algicola]|uniref:PQQ-like beta-propeller repeat protein n=1 Tax=Aquimarina algicola TaxID=2589995 RepID=A0A504J6U5_9FLAO|nr:PQQ-binding-like beta-propeller repeat protein [Aquimarina algicola]TPN86244.1 PQQ-like beta-propeller repeat protein [Aquimarina algicola]
MIKTYKYPVLHILCLIFLSLLIISSSANAQANKNLSKGVNSINTDYTITKVRTAHNKNQNYIIATSYEGTILAVTYTGDIIWKNSLSGFMNHDIWVEDITNDGIDEILTANADGSIYCLNHKGKLLWKFKQNNAPMYAVTAIKSNEQAYVVCGGYDTSLYYISNTGTLISEIPSKTYSIEKPTSRRKDKKLPPKGLHITNFIRPAKSANGKEFLVVNGVQNSMSGSGSIYFFNPLEKQPFKAIKIKARGPYGDMKIVDMNSDGNSEILLGRVGGKAKGTGFTILKTLTGEQSFFDLKKIKNTSLNRGMYRVTQAEVINNNKKSAYAVLLGSNIIISDIDKDQTEVIATKYSFNDMHKDPNANKMILGSAQSGGSAIHIINFDNPLWKKEFEALNPIGKIQSILTNTHKIREDLKEFKKPTYQKESAKVYFMTESRKNRYAANAISSIEQEYDNPIFLNGGNFASEKWDRSTMPSEIYKNKRDRRKKYTLTQDEVLEEITKRHKMSNGKGISYWGGHGNDPYMYQPSTTKKGLDIANGNKTVLVYPEIEDHSNEFEFVMNDLILPLADYAKTRNGNIYLRNKHLFWQSSVYMDKWKPLVSGKYANVFVPAMEETTDKSMELSFTSRLGLWASGAVDSWGARCARDNASFDRLRQHSNQTLPNHFLRTMVYSIASGAQYINNFSVDQKYMSLLWNLIAQGALYVPKRSEILSFSPIHISIANPNDQYLNEASNVKWLTFYDKNKNEDSFVFGRLNGTWPGAPLTEWDFSRYAAGAKERRLNFIPKYNYGMVLITPPQKGVFADQNAVRKPLAKNLHPWYKNIWKEYYSDGKNYFSANGKTTYTPEEYYKIIKKDIEDSASLLPITVSGNVGWVVTQISPKHLRLTIVENGYINPKKAKASIKVNNISIKSIKDILSNEEFTIHNNSITDIDIPLGSFRFLDIELNKEL